MMSRISRATITKPNSRGAILYFALGLLCSFGLLPFLKICESSTGIAMLQTDTTGCPPASEAGSSTSLAYRQSFGFFDDILDGAWKRMQSRARGFVQYMHPKKPETNYEDPVRWYIENLQPDFSCPHVDRVGGHDDGPKWTCDPHRLMKIPDCLIYSVGCAGKYQWEDGMVDLLGKHCEIHVFDPGNFARLDDREKRNIHYHQWGLGSRYDRKFRPDIYSMNGARGAPKLMTFQETLKELGHEKRTIHVLKLDCEQCEWASYKDWISADIRQILIETHGVPSPIKANQYHHEPMRVADFFDAFRANRFAMFSKEANMKAKGTCVEFGYVKLHPDFWKNR